MNKILVIVPIVVIIGITAFAVSPYFTESTIDEALPAGAITPSVMNNPDVTPDERMEDESMGSKSDEGMEVEMDSSMEDESMGSKSDEGMEVEMDSSMEDESMGSKSDEGMEVEMDSSMEDESMGSKSDEGMEVEMDSSMEDESMGSKSDEGMEVEMDSSMEDESMGSKSDEGMEETTMAEPVPITYAGKFIGVGDGIHDAEGDAYTIPLENGENALRLENFRSTNGPGLYVYLSVDDGASDFVSLGKLKANSGNQNYDIPSDTDLAKYNKVLIWCEPFGVLFGSAEILPQQ